MSDVRLVATNPDDGTLVPVASNSSGQLAVQSPTIQKVPNDLDVEGDLTVSQSGNITAAGEFIIKNSSVPRFKINASGSVFIGNSNNSEGITSSNCRILMDQSNGNVTAEGGANFAGTVTGNSKFDSNTIGGEFVSNSSEAAFPAIQARNFEDAGDVIQGRKANGGITSFIKATGAATFAGNKAGFTAEGYLWCTTRRGETVILDATSNGLGSWQPYTPPTLRDQVKEKLDTLRDESNTILQDLPET